ncbi:tryptophan synthase subunit alpha [Ectobacillus antri]|jgi:tryptophan synthase alpha chain|uniref:Tryptophan synthase alpha chain n=1 Tax=Ectobacillus antri TaxID=2486280 RepID=A0ABT6H8F4_9BACI|nr:tryptophan synthase subunit alpha [Ectobacillus antri]MDG4658314.1 tryptophan synthase subunit alpha [Ectobacillus antri]MDG5755597.1 tryptophan synthase subunit alpha [Ectobacillus antri]
MNINDVLNKLRETGRKAFVPYIMAGDGGMEKLKENIRFLDEAGASILEIGIPFSDPVADGPTIQRAGKRALDNGTTLEGIFQALTEVRQQVEVPFVLMTYLNPVLAFGVERFVERCQGAGVSGIIVPDLPYEEKSIVSDALERVGIALIPLVTLTSPLERIAKITEEAQGFIYAVTVTGVTGARRDFAQSQFDYLRRVKEVAHLPVLAGFGISTPEQVREMGDVCDGVVVGSRIIELLEQGRYGEIRELIGS